MRFTPTQLVEAKNIIRPYVDEAHCESFNSKIPLSVLTCSDKFEQVNSFHNNLVNMCYKMFENFEFEKPIQRVDVSSSHKPALFVIWLQDNMPDVVKYCLDSIEDERFELHIITEKNVHKYIRIPKDIRDNYKCNRICPADYSDYIRIKLLEKYNGIYFDATTLFRCKFPTYVWRKPYWSIKGNYQKNTSPIAMLHFNFGQVYALGGYDNRIYSYVRQLLDEYYSHHQYCFSYYMVYYFFEYVYRIDEQIHKMVDDVPENCEDCEQLAYVLDDVNKWSKFTALNTFFFKLRSSDTYTDEHYKFFDKL